MTNPRFLKVSFYLVLLSLMIACDGTNDNPSPTNDNSDSKVLFIQNGATSIGAGESQQFKATLVGVKEIKDVTNQVSWKVSGADTNGANISSGGLLTTGGPSEVIVEASFTENGVSYNHKVPVNIIESSSVLVVNPAAILVDDEFEDIQIATFYLGAGKPTYSFSSSDNSIATVSAAGIINIKAPGSCTVSVKANGVDGTPLFEIPVMVVGDIVPADIPLPVSRIEVTPTFKGLFINESQQFTAKAFNSKDVEVTPENGFTWEFVTVESDDAEEGEPMTPIGTFSSSGNTGTFKADMATGRGYVKVTAEGISVKADIVVVPKYVLFIDPAVVSLTPGASQSLKIITYEMDKNTGYIKEEPVANPGGVKWLMLNLPGTDEFSIGSVDASGKVTIKNDATVGMVGLVVAYVDDENYYPGGAMITVGGASACDCGSAANGAASIDVDTSPVTLQLSSGLTISRPAVIKNSSGGVIANAVAKYCSSNEQVVNVNEHGELSALSPGTATVTVCHGTLSKTIAVTVSL